MGAYSCPIRMMSFRSPLSEKSFSRIFLDTKLILASIFSGLSQIAVLELLPCKATLKVLTKITNDTIPQIGYKRIFTIIATWF